MRLHAMQTDTALRIDDCQKRRPTGFQGARFECQQRESRVAFSATMFESRPTGADLRGFPWSRGAAIESPWKSWRVREVLWVCQKETQRTTRGRVPRSGLTAESGNEILRECWDWETSAGALPLSEGTTAFLVLRAGRSAPCCQSLQKSSGSEVRFRCIPWPAQSEEVGRNRGVDTVVRDVLNRKGAKVAALGSTKNNPRNRGGRAQAGRYRAAGCRSVGTQRPVVSQLRPLRI